MDLENLTISKARELLDTFKISSLELTQYYLKKIKEQNPSLNIFITITEEKALDDAKKADEKLKSLNNDQKAEFPLLGIPYSLKDSFNTKGILTTAGSKMLSNYISPYNASIVDKLENAGAVLLGKTNMDAWGHGSSTENSDYGVTKNPLDPTRVAGGSSGGSAAAVSADLCVFSIGEDTGGSIRQPAGFCGVYGLKVTNGKVSRYGCIAYASSLDTVGPIAKSPHDLQTVLDCIKGYDNYDATVQNIESKQDLALTVAENSTNLPLSGVKFALPLEYIIEGMDSEVKTSLEKFIQKIKDLGGDVKNVNIPSTKYAIPTYYVIAMAETSTNLAKYDGIRYGNHIDSKDGWSEDVVSTRTQNFGDEAKRRIMLGTFVLSAGYYDAYYNKAQKVRSKLISEFENIYKNADVIISPISPTPAFKIGENASDPIKMYLEDIFTVTSNLVGLPSLAIPFDKTEQNLPIGIQIIGPKWSENLLISIADKLQ